MLPKLSILTPGLALCYARSPCEGRAVNPRFEHDVLKNRFGPLLMDARRRCRYMVLLMALQAADALR
jgi:hypothetical protein